MHDREALWAAAMRAERRGDIQAYEILLKGVADVMRRIFRRSIVQYGLCFEDAEDLVQEVLIAVHTKRHTWEADRPFLPWLQGIARYKLLDAARKGRREKDVCIHMSIDELAEIIEAPGQDLERSLVDVDRLLSLLPKGQQAVVRSLAIEGATVRSTAEKISKNESAVRVTFHRALRRLRAMVEND